LVNTIWGVPTTPVFVVGIPKFLLKFLPIKTSPNPQPKFATNPINTPLLTTFVLGAIIVYTPMVGMTTISD
jgi:hypothetical protein